MSEMGKRMDASQVQAFLAETRHAVVRPNGEAQLSPIWFLHEAERFYFTVLTASAKYRHLSRDPRITLCIDAGHPDARLVTLSGTAELITADSSERVDREWRILRCYHENDADARHYEAAIFQQGSGALVAVSPSQIVSWDYN